MVIVVWVNTSHSFSCRAIPTVTWVRCYRDGSWWNSVHRILPRYGRKHGLCRVIGTIAVCEKLGIEAEARARRWLRSRPGLGRGADCTRGQGSGESLVALKARARASRKLRSRLGLGRVTGCARGQGSSESLVVLEARAWASHWSRSRPWLGSYCLSQGEVSSCGSKFLFCHFFPSWLGYPSLRYPMLTVLNAHN